jgi:predicted N-acyltransferase
MYTKVYNSITEIEEDKWNSIVGRNRIICTYRYLLAVEKSNINDCKYYYPVIYENDNIIAHACVYSITTELDTLTSEATKKIINFIRKFWKKFLTLRFIECGTPVELGNVISFAEDINKSLVLLHLIKEFEKIAKNEKIGIILIRDFYDEERSFFDILLQMQFKLIHNLPNTFLENKWNNFDDYLKDIRSHYRYKINKNLNKIKQNDIKIEVCEEFSLFAENIHNLWKNVYHHAKEYKREILTEEFFINIDRYLENKSKIILLKKCNEIIGYALILDDDNTMRFMYSGLNYLYNNEYSIYFNCLYFIIKQAILEKKKDIDFGISTYIPKMDVGAKMVNLYMYMKHTNKLLNPIIINLFKMLSPKIEFKNNKFFKPKNTFEKNYTVVHN